jgi:hypothetical protein
MTGTIWIKKYMVRPVAPAGVGADDASFSREKEVMGG